MCGGGGPRNVQKGKWCGGSGYGVIGRREGVKRGGVWGKVQSQRRWETVFSEKENCILLNSGLFVGDRKWRKFRGDFFCCPDQSWGGGGGCCPEGFL